MFRRKELTLYQLRYWSKLRNTLPSKSGNFPTFTGGVFRGLRQGTPRSRAGQSLCVHNPGVTPPQ
jgi:hypothetical protein